MALTPASELIMRNQAELSGRVLFAHIPDDGLLSQLGQLESPIVLTDDWRSFSSMQHQPKLEPLFQSQVPDIPLWIRSCSLCLRQKSKRAI